MSLKNQLAQRAQNGSGHGTTINALVSSVNVKQRFEEMLGDKAAGFLSSVISIVNGNPQLKRCDPNKVLAVAATAASMDLPINPNLGFAYIVPYKNEPQFQMGYKGYIQLAQRSGQYKTINATHVFEGEIERINRITGEVVFSENGPTSDKIVGYIAYFRLINGFEKYDYMSLEEVEVHAKRFSQSYGKGFSPWTSDFDAMATKTVLKRLLSKYGILSIDMQTGVLADQAVVRENDDGTVEYDYVDGVIDAEGTVVEDEPSGDAPDFDSWDRDDAPADEPEQESLV